MALELLRRRWPTSSVARRCGVVAAAVAGLMLASAGAQAITVEIDDVAPDRVERQRAFAEGALPLAGTPDLGQLNDRLAAKGLKAGAAMFIRIFKSESELEVWMQKGTQFVLFATYPICHWAGTIGPKLREGDKQNPEGFYSIGARQLHRIGRWPRSLNIGFPNTFDKAHGRTGSYILVHGGCSSVGCFAMTNGVMAEIFALTEQSLRAGQARVDMHVFPFRMTEANLATQAQSPWLDFWRNLKEGYDAFEQTRLPPRVGICDRRYVLEPQRPGEVGDEGPLALCGVSRAALIEPSSQSLAALPPDWPQPTPLSGQFQSDQYPAKEATVPPPPHPIRSAYSGLPLPPLPSLAEQRLLLPPRESRPNRGPRFATAAPTAAQTLTTRPPCNVGLASCRKFLALRSTTSRQRVATAASRVPRAVGAEMSRALSRLTAPQRLEVLPGSPPQHRNTR
jgi:murein L,D-transpeptidase YafK